MKRTNKVVFKEYRMNQPQLLPQSVDELIPEKHLVRVVNGLVDQYDQTSGQMAAGFFVLKRKEAGS